MSAHILGLPLPAPPALYPYTLSLFTWKRLGTLMAKGREPEILHRRRQASPNPALKLTPSVLPLEVFLWMKTRTIQGMRAPSGHSGH